ncbi:MAG: hypothetical protein WDN03_11920 [Rhizomicrobium sp.]
MGTERDEASALLADVEGIEGRVRRILIYASISDFLFLWGVIWAGGFAGNYFLRPWADAMWWGLEAAGLIGTVVIAFLHHRDAERRSSFVHVRAGITVAAILGFGSLWVALTHMGWREQVTFWPTLLSFLLFLVSLWIGRALALAALGIFAVSVAGYYVAGPYLNLWMAFATGGSMIAGGFWLRR